MALVLQLIPGDDFYVGDERYLLNEIESDTSFTIKRERDGKKFLPFGCFTPHQVQAWARVWGGWNQMLATLMRRQAVLRRLAAGAPAGRAALEDYWNALRARRLKRPSSSR